MKTYSGIDLGVESTSVCVVNEKGKISTEASVETTGEAIRRVLKKHGKVRCVVEAAPLAEWLCLEVEKDGHSIDIIETRQARAVTHSKKKTDKLDARKLAQLCRSGWYVRVHRKSGRARNIRTYLTARQQVVKTKVAMAAAVRGLLKAHGIKVGKGEGAVFLLRVHAAVQQADPAVKKAVAPLMAIWKHSRELEEAMYKEVKKLAKADKDCRLLTSAPSVGPATALAFRATIDDPARFPSEEQVSSYLGLVPSIYQSGGTEYRGRITKQGDKLLRWHLVQAANNLLTRSRTTCRLREWGLRLKERKGHAKAKVAVARKLACLLYRIWVTGESFDPARA